MEDKYSSVSCFKTVPPRKKDSEISNSVKDEVAKVNLNSDDSSEEVNGYKIHAVVKDHIFHSSFFIDDWYVRLVRLYENRETENGLFVKFSLAPSLCSNLITISLDQLYSSSCPVIQNDDWMLCSGIILNRTVGDYRITCRGIIHSDNKKKDADNGRNVTTTTTTVVATSVEVMQVTTVLKRLIFAEVMEFDGWYARVVDLRALKREESTAFVEFTIAPSKCNVKSKLPSEFPALLRIVEINEQSTQEEITVVLQNLITEKKIQTSVRNVHISSLLKVEKQESFAYVEFIAAPAECDPSVQDPIGLKDKTVCDSNSSSIVILCKGNIPYSPNEKHGINCTEMKRDDPSLSKLPTHVIPGKEQVHEFEETQEIITTIKEFIIEERITIEGHQAWLDKVISFQKSTESIEMEFSIVDIFCGQRKSTTTHDPSKDSCMQRNAKKKAVCKGTISLIPGIRNSFRCTLPELVRQKPGATTPAEKDTEIDAEITISIKRLLLIEKIAIGGHHVRFDTLNSQRRVKTGLAVEFTVRNTRCDITEEISLSMIYSESCTKVSQKKTRRCKSILSFIAGVKDTVHCDEETDSGEQTDPSQPSIPEGPHTDKTTTETITKSVKEVIFTEVMTIKGRHARVERLIKYEKLTTGVQVEFSISETTCDGRLKIDPSTPSTDGDSSTVIKTIEYTEVVHTVERLVFIEKMTINGYYVRVEKLTKYERTTTGVDLIFIIPLAPTPQSPMDGEVVVTEEEIEVTTQIRQMMFAKKLTINKQQVRLDTLIKHTKIETGIEVEFTVIETTCSINDQITMEQLYAKFCTQESFGKKLICKGIISTLPELKDNVQCSERDNIEEFDPSEPSAPGSHIIVDPSNVNSYEITISIKKLMFIETMTIKGHHVRVEKLLKHKTVTMGVEVEFTILQTTCDGVVKITLEQIYSDMCAVTEATKVVVCKGLLPFQSVMKHSIRCSRGDKLSSKSDPWIPSTDVVKSVEYSKALRFVERFVFIEKMSISDHYVRVDEMSKHETSATGMDVIFTVITTTCTIEQRLSMEELYSPLCPPERLFTVAVCTGTLPFKLTVPHNVSCIFSNGTATPLSPVRKRPEEMQIVESTEVAEITSQIKELIITERLTVRGQRAQLDTLILHRKVENGIKVQFTIVESICSGNIQQTVEKLYGQQCTRLGYGKKLICKAIISTVPGVKDYVRCSEQNEIEEVEPSQPSTPGNVTISDPRTVSKGQVTISIKRLMFSETMTINGNHVRVETLNKVETVASGMLVEFTIVETTCSSRLNIRLETIYSKHCRTVQSATLIVCKGLLPQKKTDTHTIRCSGGDKLTEDSPSDPSIPSEGDIEQNPQVLNRLKLLAFHERLTINGAYARVSSIAKVLSVSVGLEVRFTITQTVCRGTQMITLEELYSRRCRPQLPSAYQRCIGILPSNDRTKPSIKCGEVRKPGKEDDQTSPSDDQTGQNTQVITSIKRLIQTQSITINGRYPSFHKLIRQTKTETGIEVEFIVTDPINGTETSVDTKITETDTTVHVTKTLICKGILSLTPGVKDSVKCEKPKDDTEEIDPSRSSTPGDTTTEKATIEKITHSIREFIFVEEMTIKGRHTRVEKLIEYKMVTTGVQVEFSIYETTCDGKKKIPLEEIYSPLCPRADMTVVICKGILPFNREMKHTIRCTGGDKLTIKPDPSIPSDDDDGTTSPQGPEYTIALRKIRRLVFIEKTSVDGYYVRVDKLTKYEKTITGTDVTFTIRQTTCATKRTPLKPKPQSPMDVEVIESVEVTEVTTQIKTVMLTKKMTINGQHARLDTFITHKKVERGIEVEFTITETVCDISFQVTVQQLYSKLCIRPDHGKTLICKGIIFTVPELKDNIQCSERDDVDEYDPSEPSTPGSDEVTDPTTVSTERVIVSIKKLMLHETMTINGNHARFQTLVSHEKVISGVHVEFTLVETTCNGNLKIHLETLYSHQCAEVKTTTTIVCKGLLPARSDKRHTIRCSGGDKLVEEYDPTKPTPGETIEEKKITASIQRLIVTQRITIEGSQARFETLISHKKTQTGIEVVFIVTDPNCSNKPGAPFDITVSETCTRLGYTKKLICRGILSLVPGEKDTVKCEDPKDYIQQIDPSQPIRPEDKHTNSITNEIITISVKEILFVETMTIKGRHARVEKLIKYQKVPTGVQVEFSIVETICDGTLKIPLAQLYSTICSRAETTTVIICKGVILSSGSLKHTIKCSGGDKLTEDYPSDPSTRDDTSTDTQHSIALRKIQRLVFIEKMTIDGSYVRVVKLTKYERATSGIDVLFTVKQTTCSSQLAPLSTKPMDVGILETTEVTQITTQIKRIIMAKRLTVDGQYARLDTLITHRKVTNGIEVEFTITDTTCNGNLELTVDQVYGHLCSSETYTKKLVCKAIISLINREYGDVKCSEQDDVEQIDPSKPSIPGEDDITDPSQTVSSEKITITIKELIFSETTTINGHHVRVEKLINYKKVTTGVHVEFTIAETKCSTKLKISLELLYSEHCKNVHGIAVVCEGLLPFRPGIAHTIKCPGVDERTDVEPSKPTTPDGEDTTDKTPVNKEEITLYIKKIMLSEIMTIRGHHVHVEKLIRAQKVTSGVFVEFTILETTCSGRLKKYNPEPSIPSDEDSVQPVNKPEIMSKLRLLTFMEKFSIRGHYVRVDSLSSAHKVPGGTQVVFTVTATVCTIRIQTSVVDPSRVKKLICKGILSLVPGVKDSIHCEELKETDEEYHKPSFPTPSQPTEAEIIEIKKITTSIKRLIVSQGIKVNGEPARFDKLVTHKRTETGIEVVFVVMDPRADNTDRTPSVWDPSVSTFTKKLICKGILSLVPGVKDTIKCEEAKDGDG
ncbi:TCP family transcription factor, partial [Trichuris trichiura]